MPLSPYIEPYYPLSKIRTGLYTKGGEFVPYFRTSDEYVGLYHELPNGDYWTESIPTEGKSIRIVPKRFEASADVIRYNQRRQRPENQYISPIQKFPYIGDDDRQTGFIFRFFVQKRNSPENTIIEVDGEQYKTINGQNYPGISNVVWNNCTIQWQIAGDYAEQLNRNAVMKAEINFPGIQKYLANYLEFWK
jgi:alpha-ketoglutarate-dependent taurine dioxygenase